MKTNSGRGHSVQFLRRVGDTALTEPVYSLAKLLLRKEYPVVFVADKLSVTRATVYNWLTGNSAPRSRLHLEAIEKFISLYSK
jgi:hypothetical protein